MQRRPHQTRREALGLVPFALATAGAAWSASRVTVPAVKSRWYRRLRKPRYQPPPQAFGPVWSVLYALQAVSGWRVWRAPSGPSRSLALELWGAQLGLNALWSHLFFGQRRLGASLAELGALLGALGGYVAVARRVDRPAAWLVAPYLGWVGFATALTAGIVRRNGPRA